MKTSSVHCNLNFSLKKCLKIHIKCFLRSKQFFVSLISCLRGESQQQQIQEHRIGGLQTLEKHSSSSEQEQSQPRKLQRLHPALCLSSVPNFIPPCITAQPKFHWKALQTHRVWTEKPTVNSGLYMWGYHWGGSQSQVVLSSLFALILYLSILIINQIDWIKSTTLQNTYLCTWSKAEPWYKTWRGSQTPSVMGLLMEDITLPKPWANPACVRSSVSLQDFYVNKEHLLHENKTSNPQVLEEQRPVG